MYNEVTFSPDYIAKPPWLWREDARGFLRPRFRRQPRSISRLLQWNEMDRDVWLLEMAVKDASITFFWVFCMALIGLGANLAAEDLNLGQEMPVVIVAGTLLLVLPIFLNLGSWMGGACWNVISLFAYVCMGGSFNRHAVVSIFIRLLAQMVGAVYAAVLVMRVVPPEYKHMVGGPDLKVDRFKGFLVEAILTFILVLVSLITMLRGPRNPRARQGISVVATVMLVILGGEYTGSSMNPTFAYGWAFVNEQSESGEHYVVYWLGPLIGALAAVKTSKWLCGPIGKTSRRNH